MTIRAGMVELVQRLRLLCDADEDEFTLAGQTYWTNEHLQTELDKQRRDIPREPLAPVASYSGGSVLYQDYYFQHGDVERFASGATGWQLEDGNGSAVGTADYTVNYDARQIAFNADTGGTIYYLTYRTYNVYRAASEVWGFKAASVASKFDVKTDNHDLKRSQLKKQYEERAADFRKMAGGNFKQMRRVDVTR